MEKVTGYINARPLGEYHFEFYVPEDMTEKEIYEKIKNEYECYIHFNTEGGYKEITETITRYEKEGDF